MEEQSKWAEYWSCWSMNEKFAQEFASNVTSSWVNKKARDRPTYKPVCCNTVLAYVKPTSKHIYCHVLLLDFTRYFCKKYVCMYVSPWFMYCVVFSLKAKQYQCTECIAWGPSRNFNWPTSAVISYFFFFDDVTYINGVDFSQLVTNDSRLDRLLMPSEQCAFVLAIFFASARSN